MKRRFIPTTKHPARAGRILVWGFILLAVILLVGSVSAQTIDIPVAEVLPPGKISLSGYSAYFPFIITDWRSEEYKAAAKLTVGLFDNLEVGLTGIYNARGIKGATGSFNLKVHDEEEYFPALAVGLQNIGGDKNLFVLPNQDQNSPYIVGTKHLDIGTIHAGIGRGRFVGDEVFSRAMFGIFFGFTKDFYLGNTGQVFSLALEVDGRDVNAGAEYTLSESLTATLAICEIDNVILHHPYLWDPYNRYMTPRLELGFKYKEPIVDHYMIVDSPADKTITHAQKIMVKGRTKKIVTVSVNDLTVSPIGGSFEVEVPLKIGFNRLIVVGQPKIGKPIKTEIRVLRLAAFDDVPNNFWANGPIEYLATMGILKGYPDGEFKPERYLTRAEFAAILERTRVYPTGEVVAPFPDVPAHHWAHSLIADSAKAGLVVGYPSGMFVVNGNITRAESVAVIARFDRLPLISGDVTTGFTDVRPRYWAAPVILAAKEAGVLNYLKESQKFEPYRKISRAEAAEMTAKTTFGKVAITWLLSFGEVGLRPIVVEW
ncbi:MAG: S-layer homology domain-containing protein [bacterium]